jgi:hypothetical protein
MTDIKPKIIFAPGCFDNFEGTQEELDNFIKDLTEFFDSHSVDEIKEMSTVLDPHQIEELSDEQRQAIIDFLDGEELTGRKDLH